MRNIFDQYSQPENRLTHALAVCLYEDRKLLRYFLRFVKVKPPTRVDQLEVEEQSIPGDFQEVGTTGVDEPKGLPDIVIHDGSEWCLIVENKIQAHLSNDQMERHKSTLRRRGFECIHSLAMTKDAKQPAKGIICRRWSDLYEWLGKNGVRGEWAERLRSYLRVAEARLIEQGDFTEGTLTMFDGFPFSTKNPYTYGEGKRLLRLATDALKKEKRLKELGMDQETDGRGAIKGRGGSGVWDYLLLKDRPEGAKSTNYPHLTLGVHRDELEIGITIPNSVAGDVRKRLKELGTDGLKTLNERILRRARAVLSMNDSKGTRLEAYALQRHYRSQSSPAITDAELRYKLETSQTGKSGKVKRQSEWAELFAKLLSHKRSNIQFGYDIRLPWETKGLNSRDSLRIIVDSWCAMKPLLEVIRASQDRKRGKN
jgi:hypothetical protein